MDVSVPNKFSLQALQEDMICFFNKDNVFLQQIDEYINNVTGENVLSERFPQGVDGALYGGHQTNAIDALFSRIAESSVSALEGGRTEKRRSHQINMKNTTEKKDSKSLQGVMTKYGKFFPPVTIEEAIAQQRRNNAQIGKKDDPCLGRSYSELKKMGLI